VGNSDTAMETTVTTMNNQHDNVDLGELEKFAASASRWWDPQSEFKPLHEINPLRLEYILRHTVLVGKKVVDVGCGGGILTESLAVAGARTTGIDLGEAALEVARLHALESGIEIDYQLNSAEAFAAVHDSQFDIVTCMELLEHVPDPSSIVAACSRLVKPGGIIFYSTLNRNYKAFTLAIVGAEYLLHKLPKGTHQYGRFIRPSELAVWCRDSGLTVNNLSGMQYNPCDRRYRLCDDVSVNYLLSALRPDTLEPLT